MKGAVRRERLTTCSCPIRLLSKWQIDPRRTLLRGTYSVVDVDISMNDCALDSRRLVLRFRLFIEKYSNSQHEICKTLFEVLYADIQKQFHVIYNDPIEKKNYA